MLDPNGPTLTSPPGSCAAAVYKNARLTVMNGRLDQHRRGSGTALLRRSAGAAAMEGCRLTSDGIGNVEVSGYADTTICDVTNDGTTWTVTAK